jgi:peroxiredoxin
MIRITQTLQEILMGLKIGDSAPDFELESHLERKVRLSDYKGKKNVVLAFFPLAWTPV